MTPLMSVTCRTAGLEVELTSASERWIDFAREAFGGQEVHRRASDSPADVRVVVAAEKTGPFSRRGLQPLTRGAWSDGTRVVLDDACTSGVDLRVTPSGTRLEVEARYRPGWTGRALGRAAPGRAVLLLRDALLQYPALWWAGRTGAVPLHVSAVQVNGRVVALAGPGGVGKSTLVHEAMAHGAWPVSDNLCVGWGTELAGLLEPLRIEGGTGRAMPHGRRESTWTRRLEHGPVERLLVLRRGDGEFPQVRSTDPGKAADVVVGGTYAAGELRRYWAFAATLTLGTGIGPAHPPIAEVAAKLCAQVRCDEVLLPDHPGTPLEDLVVEHGLAPEQSGR